jgi:predicted nuclease of predicted toxin-antitoxin system
LRLLLDTCVWGGARDRIAAAGHDCEWVGDWPKDPGDEEILAHALAEERVLVTLDKDFGELAVLRGHLHRGILRLVGLGAHEQVSICLHVLDVYQEELASGSLITATRDRVRVRPPEEPMRVT